jgi:acyl dehydratase
VRWFEDFAVGQTFDAGSVTIDGDRMVAFARDYDPQSFHVDPEAAKSSIYGGVIASGWFTVAVTMRLLVDSLLNDTASMGSPGFDGLKWLVPVRAGDVLSVKFHVTETRPSATKPDRGVMKSLVEVTNQRAEFVLTWQGVNLVGRRPRA